MLRAGRIRGLVTIMAGPVVRASQDERYRPDIEVELSADMLENFRGYLVTGDDRGTVNTLAEVLRFGGEEGNEPRISIEH
jgi:hypothetical protein